MLRIREVGIHPLPILIVAAVLSQVVGAERPILKPDLSEIIKDEGEPIEITCTSFKRIYLSYPTDHGQEGIMTSEAKISEEVNSGLHVLSFWRNHSVYGDTGWYGCADHEIDVSPEAYQDPDIAWLYVYVQSNASLFVHAPDIGSLREFSGGAAVIPCRPTSPYLTVNLTDNNDEVVIGEKMWYDPKIGFTLRNVVLTDTGYYRCLTERNGDVQAVNYHLLVIRRLLVSDPKIIEDTLRHVTRGQTLYVNCTVEVDMDAQYALIWTTPQQDERIRTRSYRVKSGKNNERATSELIIANVTDEDQGEYVCSIRTYKNEKKTSKYITVHDPGVKYINLTSQDANRNYERRFGDRVQWVAYIDSFPRSTLRWINPRGEELVGGWTEPDRAKYAIRSTDSSTILRINRLDVSDMGIYSLQASNEDKMETINFTLTVMSKPIPIMDRIEAYYAPGQIVEIQCHVAAFPAPNITWSLVKCPNYPSEKNSSTVRLPMHSAGPTMNSVTAFLSTVRMTVEMSGHLNCTACNALGCDYAIENILVSDGNGGFGLIAPKDGVTKGDDFELICAASVYNYTDQILWLDRNSKPLEQTDRLKIIRTMTRFTYRSILKIANVSDNDATDYVCAGFTTDGTIEQVEHKLIVHEPVSPFIVDSNMNQSTISIDLTTEGHKTVILKCFANGMPRPNVTWYKDGNMLKRNEQYLFLHGNQEIHIKYLLERDSGKYFCRAENRLGRKEAYQVITVKGKALPVGYIILIAILLLLVIILVIYFTIKVRREKVMRKELMEAGLMHFEEGALECLNPDLTVDDQAELLPYDKKWEFPRERLRLGKQLGSGAFGVVMKAVAQGISEDEEETTVAVKMVRRTTDPTYVRALASELKIMVHLGKHLNVVNLLGACTKNISKRELLVIVEYCRFGNLHNYLLRHRGDFVDQIDPATGKFDPTIGIDILTRTASIGSNNRVKYAALSFSRSLSVNSGTESVQYCPGIGMDLRSISMSPEGCVMSNNSSQPGWRSNYRGDYKDHNLKPICTQDLLSWAFQVARGMDYLSQRRVLHGDLAARNILLAENNVVKICDFGLAKTMYKDDNYKKKGDGPLPIKWMAIESIRDRVFSTQSDIWSFGIVLWEFFTLAKTPYPSMPAEKQYQKLIEGYRMEQPEYAMREVYDIMLRCWKAKPTLRPSFAELSDCIGDLLEESVRAHYVSLNAPYMDMNTMALEGGKNDYLTMMSAPDHTILSSPGHEYVNSPIPCSQSSVEVLASDTGAAYLCMTSSGKAGLDESGIFSPRPEEFIVENKSRFEFPSVITSSDTEDTLEVSPMLKKEEDPYLKPIDVQQRRAEFARQRLATRTHHDNVPSSTDRDSGYCNAPRLVAHSVDKDGQLEQHQHHHHHHREQQRQQRRGQYDESVDGCVGTHDNKVDTDEHQNVSGKIDYVPAIVRTQDNYVNMPKQKSELKSVVGVPDGFSNPSYVMMSNN